jgi:hypothetical protein
MSVSKKSPNDVVSVELSAGQWVTVMASLNHIIRTSIQPAIDKLREAGTDINKLPDEQVTALTGPVIALGVITKAMHEAGQVTYEGNEALGIDAFMKRIEKATGGK